MFSEATLKFSEATLKFREATLKFSKLPSSSVNYPEAVSR